MEEVYKVGGSGDGGLGRHDCEGSADQVVVYTGRVSDGICVEKKACEQRERHVQSLQYGQTDKKRAQEMVMVAT